MWINNCQEPEEMDIKTALELLRVNNWRNVPGTPDEVDVIEYLFSLLVVNCIRVRMTKP